MIPIYIASDQRMARAERVLEYSIRENTSADVEIHWMRAGDPGWTVAEWPGIPDEPYRGGGGKWATQFTGFRFAVPEMQCRGFAIYMDVDMLVLGDIEELWRYRQCGRWVNAGRRCDVSVIDCTAFRPQGKNTLRRDNPDLGSPKNLVAELPTATAPAEWNAVDTMGKCIHYSDMRKQPWRPWPERFEYPEPDRDIDRLWFEWEERAAAVVR